METTYTNPTSSDSVPPQPVPAESAPATPAVPAVDMNLLAVEAKDVLSTMLPLLSFEATLSSALESNAVRIRMVCEDAGRLIGRRGATVNEIQFLLNRILQRRHKTIPRIYLDVDGLKEKEAAAADAQNGGATTEGNGHHPSRNEEAVMESKPVPVAPMRRVEAPMSQRSPVPTPAPAPHFEPPPAPEPRGPHDELISRIKGLADQVRRWGEPVDTDPLKEEDRKIVYDLLSRDRELAAVAVTSKDDRNGNQRLRIQVKS